MGPRPDCNSRNFGRSEIHAQSSCSATSRLVPAAIVDARGVSGSEPLTARLDALCSRSAGHWSLFPPPMLTVFRWRSTAVAARSPRRGVTIVARRHIDVIPAPMRSAFFPEPRAVTPPRRGSNRNADCDADGGDVYERKSDLQLCGEESIRLRKEFRSAIIASHSGPTRQDQYDYEKDVLSQLSRAEIAAAANGRIVAVSAAVACVRRPRPPSDKASGYPVPSCGCKALS